MSDSLSFLAWLEKEWSVIANAPFIFITGWLLIALAVFLYVRSMFRDRIESKDGQLGIKEAHIEFLAAQMSAKPKTKVKANPKPKPKPEAAAPTENDEPIPPNFHWNYVQDLAFWQIAWLWVDQEPIPAVKAGTPAYPVLQMLKRDAENGELPYRPSAEGTINVWAIARRPDLKEYAKRKGENVRPKFLFTEL